jgi:S-DNA-T family DNA segregation ATPase FtsK/SpoIIIE
MPKLKRKTSRKRKSEPLFDLKDSTRRHVSAIVQVALGVVVYLALENKAGMAGRAMESVLTFFMGAWGMLFPVFLILSGAILFIKEKLELEKTRSYGLLLCLIAFLGFIHIQAPIEDLASRRDELAGAIGFMVSFPFVTFLSVPVGYVVFTTMILAGLFITFEPDFPAFLTKLREVKEGPVRSRKTRTASDEEDEEDEEEVAKGKRRDLIEKDNDAPDLNIVRPNFVEQKVHEKKQKNVLKAVKEKAGNFLEMKDTRFSEWEFPGMDLLEASKSELTVKDSDLLKQAALIQEKLKEFDMDVTMKDAHPGPTVTQFTLQPAEGVKLSKIESLKDDLALALAAQSLRIEAPIPGKALVGIEMPNEHRVTVRLREILESQSFRSSESPLSLPLGRDVSGDSVVASIEDMPHLLIAGATGSGKSVCMNTFLISLLFQNRPNELKFILIDPKRVELMPYNGIPHLLTPVITDSDKALQALRWCVAELGRRLHRFAEVNARNIAEYNEKQMEEENVLPRIVVVIDELADLMMRQHRKETETMIARIAQMARAVGMHLIVATQRPSVDVITGLIKANIPTRIAFRVVSAIDSRTILDSIGAEDLLGKGDMLYSTASTPKPIRIQGIYISTKEAERVINAVKIAGGGHLTEEISLGAGDEPGAVTGTTQTIDLESDDNGGDDLFFEAVRVVQETGKASASLLQRQLKVGYARAARLLDIMEEKGLIGPSEGAKARKIYMERTSV